MLKMQPEMTEAMEINHFYAQLRKEALQTFINISASNKKALNDVLIVFRRKYVKPKSQDTAKRKWHKLTFDPNTKPLSDVLDQLNERAERASGDKSQHMIGCSLYAKLSISPFETITQLSLPGKMALRTKLLHISKGS